MSSPIIVASAIAAPSLSGPGLAECIRHSEFWFSDGDIVLGIKSTGAQNGHLFRVHKTLLELASPVFRKSLSESDGARTIWVSRTDPNTLEYFLRFLYDPYADVSVLTLNDTILCDGFLKLCKVLEAPRICMQLIMRLNNTWPSTLSSWDDMDAHVLASARDYPKMGASRQGENMRLFHDDMFPEPVSAINLGRMYNIPDILPAALYHLSRIKQSSDYYQMHTEPTRSNADSQKRLNAGLRSARWELLAAEDHCVLAELKDYIQNCLTKLMAESSPHLACKAGMEQAYSDIVRSSMTSRDILRQLKIGFDVPRHICSVCLMQGKMVTSLMRKEIWDQLAVVLEQ